MTDAVRGRTAVAVVFALAALACSGAERSPTDTGTTETGTGCLDTESSTTVAEGCLDAGPQAERTSISNFFAAHDDGTEDEAQGFAALGELWDPVAAPYTGTLRPGLG